MSEVTTVVTLEITCVDKGITELSEKSDVADFMRDVIEAGFDADNVLVTNVQYFVREEVNDEAV